MSLSVTRVSLGLDDVSGNFLKERIMNVHPLRRYYLSITILLLAFGYSFDVYAHGGRLAADG